MRYISKYKVLLGILSLQICFGGVNEVFAQDNLQDVKNDWAYESINDFVNKGYIGGYEDNTFKPDKNITRVEFIKVVNKVFEFEQIGEETLKM